MADLPIRQKTEEDVKNDIQRKIVEIENMTHIEMAHAWRHSPPGNEMFDPMGPYYEVFAKRWAEFGGWNPAVSKAVGWGR